MLLFAVHNVLRWTTKARANQISTFFFTSPPKYSQYLVKLSCPLNGPQTKHTHTRRSSIYGQASNEFKMHSHDAALERFQGNRYYQIDRLSVCPERFLGILPGPNEPEGSSTERLTNERNKNVQRDTRSGRRGGTKRAAGNQRDPRTERVRFRGKIIRRKRGI